MKFVNPYNIALKIIDMIKPQHNQYTLLNTIFL